MLKNISTKSFIISVAAVFLISGLCFLYSAPLVFAQQSSGLNVRPSIIEEKIDPGETFLSKITLTNLDSSEKTFYVLKRDIQDVTGTGQPIFADVGEKTVFEVSSWIDVETDSFTLGGGESKEVAFTVSVPLDASPGGHFGGIFFGTVPPKMGESGAAIGFQVGTILRFRISGDIVEEAFLREFRSDKFIYSKPSAKFFVIVENRGNALIRPRGSLQITDMFGKEVGNIKVNDSASAVIPGGKRAFEVTWSGDKWSFGRYQAVAGLSYGYEVKNTVSAALSFWVFPMNIILPIAGSIIFFIAIVFLFARIHIKRKVKEMASAQGIDAQKQAGEAIMYGQTKSPISHLAFTAIAVVVAVVIFLLIVLQFGN